MSEERQWRVVRNALLIGIAAPFVLNFIWWLFH